MNNKSRIIITGCVLFGLSTAQADWSDSTLQSRFTGADLSENFQMTNTQNYFNGISTTLQYTYDNHSEVNDVFDRDQRYEGIRYSFSNELDPDSASYFNGEVSNEEQHVSTLFKSGKWLYGFSAGKGKSYIRANQTFTGVNPYFVYGGRSTNFNYYGVNAGLSFNDDSLIYYGATKVESDGLEDRNALYFGYQGKYVGATLMNLYTKNEATGHGLDLQAGFDRYSLSYRQISVDTGAHTKSLAFEMSNRLFKNGKYEFAVESVNNPNYASQNDTRFMFSISGDWGRKPSVFSADRVKVKKKKRINKAATIGISVAAAAIIASSGSSSGDSGPNVAAGQTQAARNALNRINPVSVAENREYGGFVYQNPDGSYGSTIPEAGDNDSVRITGVGQPAGTRVSASYHTHAAYDPRYDNENFSPQDLNNNRRTNLDGYLGTPGGEFKLHEVSSDKVHTLGRIAN